MTHGFDWLLRRTPVELKPDPKRVVAQLFLPGQEMLIEGESRAQTVIDRVAEMSEDSVVMALASLRLRFGDRHVNLDGILNDHFKLVAHRCRGHESFSVSRRLLIGAFFTREYSIESAALFNPSVVPHPDQSGLHEGSLRFVMSVRGLSLIHI